MALLPLAGWAAEAVDLPSNLAVTFAPMTYNGADQTGAVAIATAKAGGTDVLGKVAIEGKYADAACTNPATVKNAGTYYIRIKGDGTNYKADSYKVFNLVVAKFGDIHVSAVALPKIYGQAYPTTGYYTATMPDGAPAADREGASAPYAPSAAVGLVVTPSYTTWALNKAAGVHQFEITTNTVANYNIVVEEQYANLTINKANLTVKAKDLIGTSAVEYGTTPVYGVTYGSNLYPGDDANFGTPTYTVKNASDKTFAQAKGAVGDYTITPSGLVSSNYNFVYETGTLTVTARNISHVTFVMAGSTYDSADQLAKLQKFTATDDGAIASPAVGPQSSDFTVDIFEAATGGSALTTVTQAGKYYAEIKSAGKNYTGNAAARLEVVLAKKQLNIVTKDYTKDYDGKTVPNLNGTASQMLAYLEFNGLEAADAYSATVNAPKAAAYESGSLTNNFTLSLSTPGAANAGEYTINVSSTKAKDKIFKNYVANFVNVGIATINKAKITLKPTDVILQYGDTEPDWAAVDETAFDITGIIAGEDVDDVFETLPTINRVIPAGKTAGDVGTYDLIATDYALLNPCNYEFKEGEPKKGTLTIQAATSITVKVDNVNAVYGEYADQAALEAAGKLKYRISGVKAEDKDKVTVDLTVDDNNPDPAKRKAYAGKRGTYTIRIANISLDPSIADNYAGVSYTEMNGTLTVDKAPLKIEARTQSLMVGDKVLAASDATVKINNEKELAEADLTALFGTIKLMFSNASTATTAIVPVGTGEHLGELVDGAVTAGWTGTAPATAAADKGIWVNGIQFDETTILAYNSAENNYILTGTGAEAKAGKLIVTAADAVLALDATKTDATVKNAIDAADGKRYNVQLKNRNFKKDTWAVLVLPFETTVREISHAFGYAVVDVLDTSKGTGDYVYFKITTGKINANQPFMLKIDEAMAPDATTKITTTFNGKVIVKSGDVTTPTAADIDAGGTEFIGIWKLQQLQGAKQLWYNDATGWSYNKDGKKVNVNPTLAYLQLPEESTGDARIFIEEPDGSTTAITAIAADGTAIAAEGWYTLNGIRLQGAPTEKGVYINNGKKVVIK